jgi:hypothetical protein
MRGSRSLIRVVALAAAAVTTFWLLALNCRLYEPNRVDTAIAQLRFLAKSLEQGGAERMQSIFPEGYVYLVMRFIRADHPARSAGTRTALRD